MSIFFFNQRENLTVINPSAESASGYRYDIVAVEGVVSVQTTLTNMISITLENISGLNTYLHIYILLK